MRPTGEPARASPSPTCGGTPPRPYAVGARRGRRTGTPTRASWSRRWWSGDDGGLDPALADDFRTTGLTHLLAVSGTNLTLVVGFLLVLGRWLGVRGRWLHALAALGIVGFVLIARAEPSVVRAAAMGTVALVGMGSNGRSRGVRGAGRRGARPAAARGRGWR